MFLRIAGRDLLVSKASIAFKQNEISEFEATVPAQSIPRDQVQYSDAALYFRGTRYVSGLVLDPPELELSTNSVLSLRIRALDELGRLTCYRAVTDAHFQDIQITTILSVLLGTTSDWSLGDVSTMVDPLAVTTIDLRNKETLFAQIAEVVKATPRCFMRYGGFSAGLHRLDIGFFGAKTTYAMENEALSALKLQSNGKRTYRLVEAFADRSNQTRLTLNEALSDPRYATDPDSLIYPITLDGTKYIVTNTLQPRGCETAKAFNIIKTKNDVPASPTEVAEAGYALWKKAIRFLQQNESYTNLTLTGYVANLPRVSDMVYVQTHVSETVFDHVSQSTRKVSTFEVSAWFRMTKINFDFDAVIRPGALPGTRPVETYEWVLDVTDNDYIELIDPDVAMYERVEVHDNADIVSGVNGEGLKGIFPVPITHVPADPADVGCLPDIAKEYMFPLPATPAGATQVTAFLAVTGGAAGSVTVTQNPAIPGTPLIACVQAVGGGWPGATAITLTATYIFI